MRNEDIAIRSLYNTSFFFEKVYRCDTLEGIVSKTPNREQMAMFHAYDKGDSFDRAYGRQRGTTTALIAIAMKEVMLGHNVAIFLHSIAAKDMWVRGIENTAHANGLDAIRRMSYQWQTGNSQYDKDPKSFLDRNGATQFPDRYEVMPGRIKFFTKNTALGSMRGLSLHCLISDQTQISDKQRDDLAPAMARYKPKQFRIMTY